MENRLRLLRAARNWSQQDLAGRLEVSRQSVNAIETGKYDPSLPLAFRIAELFDRSIEEIFVLPQYRRTTVARMLVDNALKSFRASGCHRFQLRVLERNDAGKAFWQQLGFLPAVTIYEYAGPKE